MVELAQPPLPTALSEAVAVVGNRVRVAILLSLVTAGAATVTELSARLNVTRSLVSHHVAVLEKARVVSVDPPRTEPDVRRRMLSVDKGVMHEVLAGFALLDPTVGQ